MIDSSSELDDLFKKIKSIEKQTDEPIKELIKILRPCLFSNKETIISTVICYDILLEYLDCFKNKEEFELDRWEDWPRNKSDLLYSIHSKYHELTCNKACEDPLNDDQTAMAMWKICDKLLTLRYKDKMYNKDIDNLIEATVLMKAYFDGKL